MEEVWKDVPGYDGIYQVSNLGNVRTVKMMKPFKIWNGYSVVSFYKDGKEKHQLIHRLVAQAFLENPNNLPQVNHKDENKENNVVDNLEWCTRSYNRHYGTSIQRMIKNKSKKISQYSLDGKFIAEHQSAIEIERMYGYDHSTIAKCCNGKQTQAYGYMWKYA